MSEPVLVYCPSCKTKNRVSLDRARAAQPLCGKCKAPVYPAMPGYPVEASDRDFDEQVLRSGVPTLVDFYSSHCGPCRQMEAPLERLAYDLAGKVRIVKVNTDHNRLVPSKYSIEGVPTFVLFRGVEVGRLVGAQPVGNLKSLIDRYAAA